MASILRLQLGLRTLFALMFLAAVVLLGLRWWLDDGRVAIALPVFVPKKLLSPPPASRAPVHLTLALRWPTIDPRDDAPWFENLQLVELVPLANQAHINSTQGAMCTATFRIRRGDVSWLESSHELLRQTQVAGQQLVLRPGSSGAE